jgi:hypothetical protein
VRRNDWKSSRHWRKTTHQCLWFEAICIYCDSGTDSETGEPMTQVTLSNIWAMDSALATQVERWRFFRKSIGVGSEEGYFANHARIAGRCRRIIFSMRNPVMYFLAFRVRNPGRSSSRAGGTDSVEWGLQFRSLMVNSGSTLGGLPIHGPSRNT